MTTETNAERLESAKRLITAVREANSVDDPKKFWSSLLDLFGFGYLDLLLQQAERAQVLAKQAGTMMWDAAELAVEKRQLEIENDRLREGLKSLSKEVGRHGVYGGFISKATSTNIQWDIDEILQQEDSK